MTDNSIRRQTSSNLYNAYNYYNNGAANASQSNAGVAMNVLQTSMDVNSILSSDASAEQKAELAKRRISLAVADYYTFGLASNFSEFAHKQWPGTMAVIDKYSAKLDPVVRLIGSVFGSKNMWQTEGKRTQKLLEQGINVPKELQGAMNLTRGRSKEELINKDLPIDFRGYTADGTYVNNLFANSRDVKDLAAEDIWGYSAFFEKFGNDWLGRFTPQERSEIASAALKSGAVDEHHGTIDINWDAPGLSEAIEGIKKEDF